MRLTLGTHTLRRLATLASAGVLAVGLAAAGAAGSASAGTHHAPGQAPTVHAAGKRPPCIVDNDGDCLQTVKGTVEATAGLRIRSGPGTGYSIVGTMPYLSTGTVYCWASGTNVNGDPYWDWTASSYGDGYVADYYLFTGGNPTGQVDPC
jgi:hypothetical protein